MTDRAFPALLEELHKLDFDYADGDGYDFEPLGEFLSDSETRDWIRAWTGNAELDGAEFFVFGLDGTGGYAAFWKCRPDAGLLEQPVVFLGSDGNTGVVARNFSDYLWLLAGGVGPREAVEDPESPPAPDAVAAGFRRFAEDYAGQPRRTPAEVLDAARREFPGFDEYIESLCR